MDFRVADVPTTGVVSFNGAVNTVDTYRASVLADTPCQDPTGKNTTGRILNNVLLGQLIAFVAGLAIEIPVRRYGPPHTITKQAES